VKTCVVLLLAAVGCGYHPDQAKVVPAPERADEATALVVKAFAISHPPAVYWYAPDDGCHPGITDPEGECVFGFRVDDTAVLSTQNGVPMSQTALAHELGHLASLEHDGTSDNACHNGRYFKDPGDAQDCKIPSDQRGLVGSANRMLEAMGL